MMEPQLTITFPASFLDGWVMVGFAWGNNYKKNLLENFSKRMIFLVVRKIQSGGYYRLHPLIDLLKPTLTTQLASFPKQLAWVSVMASRARLSPSSATFISPGVRV